MDEYNGYSDEELANRKDSLRREISRIEAEQLDRHIREKKRVWEVLVRELKTYCAEYGAIEICNTVDETFCVLTEAMRAEKPGHITV